MINKVKKSWKMMWKSFYHVSAAAVVPIWPNLQPTNPWELTAFQKGQKTSNDCEFFKHCKIARFFWMYFIHFFEVKFDKRMSKILFIMVNFYIQSV